MKKILLTFLALFFVQASVLAFDHSIKFVQVTDVHFNRTKDYQVKLLESLVQDINSQYVLLSTHQRMESIKFNSLPSRLTRFSAVRPG